MSTLLEIESAIERLSAADRAELAQWWKEHFDPDAGLELRDEVAAELDAARREIARGEVADWAQLKHAGKPAR